MLEVNGAVSPAFAAVEEAFRSSDVGAGGAAFAVYVGGEKVVDLWGGCSWRSVGVRAVQTSTGNAHRYR